MKRLMLINIILFLLEMGTELAKFFRYLCKLAMWLTVAGMMVIYLVIIAFGTMKYAFHRINFFLEIGKDRLRLVREQVIAEEMQYPGTERRATVRVKT